MANSAVCVLTFNRAPVIDRSLKDILRYTDPKVPVAVFEDAGYFDDTESVLLRNAHEAEPSAFDRAIEARRYTCNNSRSFEIFMGTRNLGVAGNSNRAIHWFMTQTDADHLCLCNDDILVQGDFVDIYRKAHERLGLGMLSLMPFDDIEAYRPSPVVYRGQRIKLCSRMTGIMISLTRECIEDVGYFDMTFGRFGQEHSCPCGSKVWMGNYSFSSIENIKVGDEVIGWTRREKAAIKSSIEPSSDTLCKSTVIGVKNYVADNVVRVTMESGTTFECTADHWWWNYSAQEDVPYVNPVVGATLAKLVEVPEAEKEIVSFKRAQEDRVVKVEPIAPARVYCLTTTTGNYVVHGYASKNCDYTNRARFMGHISLDGKPQGMVDIAQDCVSYQNVGTSLSGTIRDHENALAEIALAKVTEKYKTEACYKPFATEKPKFAGAQTSEVGIDYDHIKTAYTLVTDRVPFSF